MNIYAFYDSVLFEYKMIIFFINAFVRPKYFLNELKKKKLSQILENQLPYLKQTILHIQGEVDKCVYIIMS